MKIQNRQQLLLVLTLGLLALYLGDLLVFEPGLKWWKSREANVSALRQQVAQGEILIRRKSVIQAEWDRIHSDSLANDSSRAEQQLLKAVESWADDSGVNVDSVTPQWQNDQSDYSTLDCRVEARGDIGSMSRFLYKLENAPLALQLESVALTSTDDKGQSLSLGLDISGLALVTPQK